MPTPAGGRVHATEAELTPHQKAAATRAANKAAKAKSRDRSVVTGVDHAWVNVPAAGGPVSDTPGVWRAPTEVVLVSEGEELPAGVSPEEVDRLDGLGVFGEHPRETAKREMDKLVAQGLAARSPEPDNSPVAVPPDGDDVVPEPGSVVSPEHAFAGREATTEQAAAAREAALHDGT